MISANFTSFLQGLGLTAALSLLTPGCGPSDAADAGDGGRYGGGHNVGDGGAPPQGSPVATLPCRFVSDIDFWNNRLLGVCARRHGAATASDARYFFEARETASGELQVTPRTDVTLPGARSLSQIVPTRGGKGILTANDGIYVVDLEGASPATFISFPEHHGSGTDALFLNNSVFVGVHYDDGTSWGRGGEILIYDVDAEGNITNPSGDRHIEASTFHPTAIAVRPDGLLIVLSRGDASINLPPVVDRMDPVREMSVGGFLLPEGVGAQTGGELAVSEDGNTAIVGTADGSGRLYFVNLQGHATDPVPFLTLAGTSDHTSLKVRNGRVYVTDFSGAVSVVDIASRTLVETVSLDLDEAMASEFSGASLLQAGARSLHSWEAE